jgi:hypothetical protein
MGKWTTPSHHDRESRDEDREADGRVSNQVEKLEKHWRWWLSSSRSTGLPRLREPVALSVVGGGAPSHGDDPVGGQYTGAKAALRPIYDALVGEVRRFGTDVEISPKKANGPAAAWATACNPPPRRD